MKLKQCNKGFNCGFACINKQLKCKQNIKLGATALENYAMFLARKTSQPLVSIAQARNELVEKAFREEFSLETIKLAEEASLHWAKLLESSKLATQVGSLKVIEAIIDDRMKSQFETSTSGGVLNIKARAQGELRALNVAAETEPRSRPVYGYLANADVTVGSSSDSLASYGFHRLILKDSVKDRATYTATDSLDKTVAGNQAIKAKNHIAQLLTGYIEVQEGKAAFNWQFETLQDAEYDLGRGLNKALKAKTLSEFREAVDTGSSIYTEAQIFGDVRAEHIERIEFDSNTKPSKQLLDKLEANGIKHSYSDMFSSLR